MCVPRLQRNQPGRRTELGESSSREGGRTRRSSRASVHEPGLHGPGMTAIASISTRNLLVVSSMSILKEIGSPPTDGLGQETRADQRFLPSAREWRRAIMSVTTWLTIVLGCMRRSDVASLARTAADLELIAYPRRPLQAEPVPYPTLPGERAQVQ